MAAAAPVRVRPARPAEYAAAGELTVRAYAADRHGSGAYAERLRDAAGRAAAGTLLIATGAPETVVPAAADQLLGTVALFAAGAEYAQLAGPGEMEIRMLAVDPAVRGRGVGTALAVACLRRAEAAGATGVRLSTEGNMRAAHRIYERLGFRRTPDRDWSPVPGSTLLTYALEIDPPAYCDRCGGRLDTGEHAGCAAARRLEPPRHCLRCGRRLVVQVMPRGWTARCSRHGERSGDEADLA